MTASDVLAARGFTLRTIVVTANGTLVPTDDYAARPVADGDRIRRCLSRQRRIRDL